MTEGGLAIIKGIGGTKKIIKDTFFYTISKYMELGAGFLQSLIIAKYLGPALLGAWGVAMLIVSYSGYANLGVINSVNKYVSIKRSQDEEAAVYRNTSFGFIILLCSLFILAGAFVQLMGIRLFESYSILNRQLVLIAVIVGAKELKEYFHNVYTAYERFFELAVSNILSSILRIAFIILLLPRFGFGGLVAGYAATSVIVAAYLWLSLRIGLTAKISFNVLRSLISNGILLMLYNMAYFALTSVDRIMISMYLEEADMGYYTFAFLVSNAVLLSALALGFILFPKLLNIFGNTDDREEMLRIIDRVTPYAEVFSQGLILAGLIAVDPAVTYILPEYGGALGVLDYLMMSKFFLAHSTLIGTMLVAKNRELSLIRIQAVSIVAAIILNYVMIVFGYGIVGIAAATWITFLIYAMMTVIHGLRYLGLPFFKAVRKTAGYYSRYAAVLLTYFVALQFFSRVVAGVLALVVFLVIQRRMIIKTLSILLRSRGQSEAA